METILRPSHSCAVDRTIITRPDGDGPTLEFGANAARSCERTCQVLAQLIDTFLTAVFLVASIVQAALLCLMVAGQTLG